MQHLNSILLSATTGTAAAATLEANNTSGGEPLALQILRLLLPSIVSIITVLVHKKIDKKQRVKKIGQSTN